MARARLAALAALLLGAPALAAPPTAPAPPWPRAYLTATKTYYVKQAGGGGSDANDCASPTSACLTVQHVVDFAVSKLDGGAAQTIVINVAGGTYTNGAACAVIGAIPGNSIIQINGNGSLATVSTASGNCYTAQYGGNLLLSNLSISNSSGYCVGAQYGGIVTLAGGPYGIAFGSCAGGDMDAQTAGLIVATAGITLNNGFVSQDVWHAHGQGQILFNSGVTVTCAGSGANTQYFAGVGETGILNLTNIVFSGCGAITGPRFTANRGSGIRTDTNNPNLIPGSQAGTLASNASLDDYGTGGWTPRLVASGSADSALAADHVIVWKSASGAAKAETLAACTSTGPWQPLEIVDDFGDAATNNITIAPASGTILGAASVKIAKNWGALTVQCDGAGNYYPLGNY